MKNSNSKTDWRLWLLVVIAAATSAYNAISSYAIKGNELKHVQQDLKMVKSEIKSQCKEIKLEIKEQGKELNKRIERLENLWLEK